MTSLFESLFPFLILIGIIISIANAKKKKQAQDAAKQAQAQKRPQPAPAPDPFEDHSLSGYSARMRPSFQSMPSAEGVDPCHADMFPGYKGPRLNPDDHEGEDPCHEDMLTGPVSREEAAEYEAVRLQNADLLRGIIISQVLTRPVSMRKRV